MSRVSFKRFHIAAKNEMLHSSRHHTKRRRENTEWDVKVSNLRDAVADGRMRQGVDWVRRAGYFQPR